MSDLNTPLAAHGVILAQRNGIISLFPVEGSPFTTEWDALHALYPKAEAGDPALRKAFATLYRKNPIDIHTLYSENMPRRPQNQIALFLAAYPDAHLVRAVREWDEQRVQSPRFSTPTLDQMGAEYMGESHLSAPEAVQLHSQIIVQIRDIFAQRGLPRTAFTQSDLAELNTATWADLRQIAETGLHAPAHAADVDARPGDEVIVRAASAPDTDVCVWVHAVHRRGRDAIISGRVSDGARFGEVMTFTADHVHGLHVAPAPIRASALEM